MAALDEAGELGVPREGRLTGGLDLGEIVLGRAVLKGPAVAQGKTTPQAWLSQLSAGAGELELWVGAAPA